MEYRRAFVPGSSFFFTLVTERRRPILSSEAAIEVLREAFRKVRSSRPFEIDAIAVLPDHLHCIWTLPPGDADYATRWRLIKTWFTKHCDSNLHGKVSDSRRRKQQQAVWQHRYWEHMLRDEADYVRHVEYIHYNPVKHGLAATPVNWPYSSFHGYVKRGIYPADWGGCVVEVAGIGSE